MKPALKTGLTIVGLIFYLWLCIFFFPMIHDFWHELGHAAYLSLTCGLTWQMSLGAYGGCPNAQPGQNTICVQPGWFYKSLYRQSEVSSFGSLRGRCSAQTLAAMGGVMGLLLSWYTLTVVVTTIWLMLFYRTPRYIQNALVAGTTFLFVPHWRLNQLHETKRLPFYVMVILGFGALLIQWDMLNDFFYSFFPSRLIVWDFLVFGDGTTVWRLGGIRWETIVTMSYVVFVMLLLLYSVTMGVFVWFCVGQWRRRYGPSKTMEGEGDAVDNSSSQHDTLVASESGKERETNAPDEP